MKELVYNYPTKHKEGFTNNEIESLIVPYMKQINMDKFNNALRGITCMMIDNELVIYHCDVLLAINCGLENRDIKSYEFD